MPAAPYVVGQWVRGERFYGRRALLDEILEGPRNCMWLLGTRRLGKTSLLRQAEYLTADPNASGYVPIFWDLQGSATPDELHAGFVDALLDAEDRLQDHGIEYEENDADMFRTLSSLRRGVRAKGWRLLLLCDEVEELIKLDEQDPSLLRKLRRALQINEDLRCVISSTIRLWALSDRHVDTSPFLHGFLPPLYIGTLEREDARALIRQVQAAEPSRPSLDDTTVETILERCAGHPYLLQLVSKRAVELGDAEEATLQVATDPMVSFFFSVDFEMLSDAEKKILRLIGERRASTSDTLQADVGLEPVAIEGLLHRLTHLGFVARDRSRRFVLTNYFFRRWFKEQPAVTQVDPPSDVAPTVRDWPPIEGAPKIVADRYALVEEVGDGATGQVYRAHDQLLRVDVALKLLRAEYATHPDAFERFRDEIVLSREIAHPNVVKIYHLGKADDRTYLTMQWVQGPNLATLLEAEAPFDEARTVAMACDLASALAALHDRKVLHRDIKPQNILVDASDTPHLTDFGLARLVGKPGITSAGIFVGTPHYASPEQAALLPLDERSDLYSLGLVLYEMCTGKGPFDDQDERIVLDCHRDLDLPAPPPRQLRAQVSEGLSTVIARCLEKDPAKRYASAQELLGDLSRLRQGPDGTLTRG